MEQPLIRVVRLTFLQEVDRKRKEPVSSLLAAASRWMDPQKQVRLSRSRFSEHRIRMLYAELLLHYTLSETFGLSAEQRKMIYGSKGKPALAASPLPPIHYNVSHSGCWIACAFDSRPVGIDVEMLRRDGDKLAPLFLTPDEYDEFSRLEGTIGEASSGFCLREEKQPSKQACEYITRRWTLKESIVKADGAGLSQPLHKLMPVRQTDGSWAARLGDRFYRIRQYRLDRDCWMSVCRSAVPASDPGAFESGNVRPAAQRAPADERVLVPEVLRSGALVEWAMSQL